MASAAHSQPVQKSISNWHDKEAYLSQSLHSFQIAAAAHVCHCVIQQTLIYGKSGASEPFKLHHIPDMVKRGGPES